MNRASVSSTWWVSNLNDDNVAVCLRDVPAGIPLPGSVGLGLTAEPVARGMRIARVRIPPGESVVQYGSPFAISRGIEAGACIRAENTDALGSDVDAEVDPAPPEMPRCAQWDAKTFSGFDRGNGRVGTRNVYLVVPTSMCASDTARWIAEDMERQCDLPTCFPNVDGVAALTNTEGCGCAANEQIDRFMRVLRNFMRHPNTAGALIIDLGCEQTNEARLRTFLGQQGWSAGIPVDWLTIQNEGGAAATVKRAMDIAFRRLAEVNAWKRTSCPICSLIIGTECGASDAFSGLTANPLIGAIVDRIIAAGGRALLTEFPEMVGAERVLMRRMRNRAVMAKFRQQMKWYQDLAQRLGVCMSDNLVPENLAGGLINPCIKSLGAIMKGGTTAIEDVLEYGEQVSQPGLSLMQGPGNDPESVTGLAAAGANLILFSTGKGALSGCALVPVVKIASSSDLYRRMPEDMDFNAGRLLEQEGASREVLTDELFELMLAFASGRRTCAEQNRQTKFQVWTAGKLSL